MKWASVLIGLTLLGSTLAAKANGPRSLEDQVRHELLMLPYIGVFDNLSYSVDPNGVVTLSGEVVRPIDRYNAEQAVKSLQGVARIDNQIEVLPLSPFDDRIRFAMLRSLERTHTLDKYFWGVHPAIRIVVKNGHVTLDGDVLNEGDRTIAFITANGVPGVFSVTNNLQVNP